MPIYRTYNCLNCNKLCENKPNTHGKYCNNACQGQHSRKKLINKWTSGKIDKIGRKIIREWLSEKNGYQCSCCGISEWQNKPITLWVDHIDGDASNNKPDNFKLICPNCDSQQDTFGAKNYGKGRKSRGLPQYG
jgi:hypothetical protein